MRSNGESLDAIPRLSWQRDDGNQWDLTHLEWLETNGLGGWASSTLSGAHSRGYHGLLVAATRPPTERHVLLSRLDESIRTQAGTFELATRRYNGAVHPDGSQFLKSFSRDEVPVFHYEVSGCFIKKSIAAIDGENSIIIVYELSGANQSVIMEARPFVAYRGYHDRRLCDSGFDATARYDGRTLVIDTNTGLPACRITGPKGAWENGKDWYYGFEYQEELARGLPGYEDLLTPGRLVLELRQGKPLALIVTTDTKPNSFDPLAAFHAEIDRRKRRFELPRKNGSLPAALATAADQFIVRRGTGKTIIAGYPWFTDWGRDTMISLPGICLVNGWFEEARDILRSFAAVVDQGMIPNRFPDGGEEPEYNTVDATLWMFVAAYRYLHYSGDTSFVVKELLPVLLDIISWHERGTRFGIKVDPADGLLVAGDSNSQLTWMDARVHGIAVTPRYGKTVEINALWYNALLVTSELAAKAKSKTTAHELLSRAQTVATSFDALFWDHNTRFFSDCITPLGRDSSLRPNQVMALGLPFAIAKPEHAQSVIAAVENHLLTPFGLRTLDPRHPHYRGRYYGSGENRDSAYHQGTVWPWLLGPFITGLVRFDPNGRSKARAIVRDVCTALDQTVVGSLAEIFEGDPPYSAKGAPAQAWSVAEVLRAYIEDVLGTSPKPR